MVGHRSRSNCCYSHVATGIISLFGVSSIQDAATPFANKVIYLFLGGFIVAFAMQRWNLHKRIALTILQYVGGDGKSLVAGFMFVSAALSMWVMNTSTTMMLLPIAISVITVINSTNKHISDRESEDFQYSILLVLLTHQLLVECQH